MIYEKQKTTTANISKPLLRCNQTSTNVVKSKAIYVVTKCDTKLQVLVSFGKKVEEKQMGQSKITSLN